MELITSWESCTFKAENELDSSILNDLNKTLINEENVSVERDTDENIIELSISTYF